MTKILAISGSLRKQSLNTALVKEAARLAGDNIQVEIATLHGIPLYDGDVEEASGIPEAVDALKAKILAADALLISTPEYNGSIPGVLKNALDWLSRPTGEAARVFGGRPLALIGASPGGFGTLSAQTHWLPVFKSLGANYWSGGSLLLSRAHQQFDQDGKLTDEATAKRLTAFLQDFATFVKP